MIFNAMKAAALLHEEGAPPLLVAGAISDGEGGVYIQVGFAEMEVGEAELVAATILRDVRNLMQQGEDAGHCAACARRWARVTAALVALEVDGAVPTGQRRGPLQ